MKISALLMTHNEERLVEAALRSLRAVADEILVGHDGPCRDATLERARPLADKVIEFDFRGAPEVNTIKLLRRASHDWILRIDCDETLSPELIERVLEIKRDGPPADVTHYNCVWTNMAAVEEDASGASDAAEADRALLFKRSCTTWIGLPHRTPQTRGRGIGINADLQHWAPHQHYNTWQLITKKLLPFAKRDARIRVGFPLETFGFDDELPAEDRLLWRDRIRHEAPLLTAMPLASLAFSRSLMGALGAESLVEMRSNLRWPVAHGLYQLALGYNIARELRRNRDGA